MMPPLRVVAILAFTWTLFGAAMWVTTAQMMHVPVSLLYLVGAYCVAYVAGFFVPFAPAGLGVREAVLVFAMSPMASIEVGMLLAGLNRIIYFAAELVLAFISLRPIPVVGRE